MEGIVVLGPLRLKVMDIEAVKVAWDRHCKDRPEQTFRVIGVNSTTGKEEELLVMPRMRIRFMPSK